MKIQCTNPKHDDKTPSMEIYPSGHGYCFVCAYRDDFNGSAEVKIPEPEEPEDVAASVAFIKTLPVKRVRGLDLPCSSIGFFIVWHDESYYKFRFFEDRPGRPRYIGAKGHRPPLFKARWNDYNEELLVIEGELNALSAAILMPKRYNIVSPGSATSIIAEASALIENYPDFAIEIWTDKDAAGIKAAWHFITEGHKQDRLIAQILTNQDANQLLQERNV